MREFHEKFGHPVSDNPSVMVLIARWRLRLALLEEEQWEFRDAALDRSLVKAFDALLDLQYVLDGAFLALGFHRYKDAGMAEVHRSNMSKLGADGKPILREDGKILKGPNYTPPDPARVMREVDEKEKKR